MSKQDRTYTRTAAQVEQKYDLGGATYRGTQDTSQLEQAFSQFVVNTNARLAELEGKFATAYPVGSVYIGVNETDPSTLIGGTWELTGQGYLVVGLEPESEDSATRLQFLDSCYIWKRTA